jgi:NitT/TauT family transport system permease protein
VESAALKRPEPASADEVQIEAAPVVVPPEVSAVAPQRSTLRRLATYGKRWFALHRHQLRSLFIGTTSLALFLLSWHLLTKYRIDFHIRFINVPSPAQVLESLSRAMHNAQFANHVLLSCRRIFFGFMIATLIAVPLGLVMGRFRFVRDVIFPVSEVLRPIPAIAWVPMSIMLWPSNEESIVFITFLGSFFPILLNTLHGMATVDSVLVRAAQCLGARELSIFREVYFPAALPNIFTGLTVGMGVAWVSLIAAEMISGQFGIGYYTWEAYSLVQYADIALGMICIGILGLGSSAIIRAVGKLVMPWGRA